MKRILQTTVILLIPFFLFSQELGKIAGRVTDEATGEPLAGANILVEGTSFGAASDAEGNYIVLGVPVGVYTVRGEFIGYRPLRISNLRVSTRLTTAADFTLTSEAIELGAVNVVAVRPLINPSATNAIRSIAADQIENLATRNVADFFNIQAGVVVQDGQIHIRGGRVDEVGYEIEGATTRAIGVETAPGTAGASATNIQSGNSPTAAQNVGGGVGFNMGTVIPEALEEISIQSGGYGADLGGANSGIVQQKLKTGGSTLSGKVLYETDAFAPGIGGALDGVLGSDESYEYGAQDITVLLGGPLLSNRIRFFGAYQMLSTDDYNPQFWTGATINEGNPIVDLIAGLTPSGDSVAVSWEDGEVPGRGAGVRRSEANNFNGTLLLDFNPLVLRVGGYHSTSSTTINGIGIMNMFNPGRLPTYDVKSGLVNVKGTFFLSPKTLVNINANTFSRSYEQYDPNFAHETVEDLLSWDDSALVAEKGPKDADGNPLWVYESEWTQPYMYNLGAFRFYRPGDRMTNYLKGEQSYIGLDGGLVSQVGVHELKLGFDWRRWTYRTYSFGARGGFTSVLQEMDAAPALEANLTARDEVAARLLRRSRAYGIGYDEFGREITDEDHPDGPRNPWNLALYLNDKIEMNDIIINAGLRMDQYNLDDLVLNTTGDEMNPPYNETEYTLDPDSLGESKTRTIYQPRLGLAFPLTDKSVFHLQYGKFAQFPDVSMLYQARGSVALLFAPGYFWSNPSVGFDRDPIITTQYEVGYTQQLAEAASFDITAFARYSTGQLVVEIREVEPDASHGASPYVVYTNGDFTTVSGLELTLNTRRIGPVQGFLSYTWMDASGTNSFPNSNTSNLDHGGIQRPSLVTPLYYSQRHSGALNLDVRFGEREGGIIFANSGVNLLFTFNSGHPFTKATGSMGQRAPEEGALLTDGDARNRKPTEPIGSSTTPWIFNTDLKVDKSFKVGGASLQVYLLVSNLFNRMHSINVYNRTGNAHDDGFLSNPELSEIIVEGQGEVYEELYRSVNLDNRQHYMVDQGFDLFGRPRQIKVGLAVGF